MDMIWCFGRSLCFSRVCANKSGSGLCLVSEEILCESERDITRGEGLSTSPGSYNRQECWIIKTNPGRVECDGEPRQQSVGKLLRSDTMYNGHQMWAAQLGRVPGVSWTCDVVTSDPVTSVITIRPMSAWWLRQITREWIDYIPPTGSRPPVRCVCRALCLCSD